MSNDPPPTISERDWARTPPAVRALLHDLIDMVRALSVEVQELRVRVNQTSKNSSKPPSSDPPVCHPLRLVCHLAGSAVPSPGMPTSSGHSFRLTRSRKSSS
jgi:hypothetical protein